MSKQPPPAPTASANDPNDPMIQIVGRPGTGSLPRTIAPPDQGRTRGSRGYFQERIKSEVYDNSFFPRTSREWNSLPGDVTDLLPWKSFGRI